MHRLAVAVALLALAGGALATDPCPGDADRSGAVEIDELVQAVDNALGGCPVPCPGDCDGDGEVSDAELTTIEAIGAGDQELAECLAADLDSDCSLRITESIAAIQANADGCP